MQNELKKEICNRVCLLEDKNQNAAKSVRDKKVKPSITFF